MSTNQQLSPEAQKLNEALAGIFAQAAEAFRKLAEPRYTMAEIKAALVECGCWRVQDSMQRELEARRERLRAS